MNHIIKIFALSTLIVVGGRQSDNIVEKLSVTMHVISCKTTR